MNIATFSPALVLLFVCALLWILMDVRFQDLTKTQRWLTPLLILFLCVFNHILRVKLGPAAYSKLLFLTMHLPYFLLFLYLTKCGGVKMAFMIFSAVVFTSPTIFIGNIVKSAFASSPLALLLANLLTYLAILLLAHFVFRQGFNYLIKYGSSAFLLRFSLVPLLYYIYLFAAMNLDFSPFSSPSGYVIRLLPTIYVFLFYFLLLHNYKDLNELRRLETSQATLHQQLAAAAEQIALLNKAQSEVAIHQHNMRHHLNAISGFLSAGNPQQAKEYIKAVQNDVDAITPKRFCENELVNLLCSSFVQKAEQQGILLTVKAKLPRQLSISDRELCSILSNGLENALHAVAPLEDSRKWAKLFCGLHRNKLLIEIKNPYEGEVLIQDGLPFSAQTGHGYGCRSILSITEQNGGLCAFETESGVFTLQIILPLRDPDSST